jgi:hypothetical protein
MQRPLRAAQEAGVELWDFRTVISDRAEACKDPTNFINDTLRTVQLFQKAKDEGIYSNSIRRIYAGKD